MDFSRFKTSDWMKIGGAAGFLVFGIFVGWVTVSIEGFGSDSGDNAFDFFLTGLVPLLLVLAVGVITFLLAQGKMDPKGLPWPLIMVLATGLAAVLVVLRVLIGPNYDEGLGVEFGRGAGMYLSAISAIVAAVGAFLGFKESGGDINDLKDVNKIKGAFNAGPSTGGTSGATAPPPPPPPPAPPAPPSGEMPPPPPPA